MPFLLTNCSNSTLVEAVPLSVTKISGRPKIAKTLIFSMVIRDVAEPTTKTSTHFEYASANTNSILPIVGLA